MAPKRPAEELFRIHKRTRVSSFLHAIPPSASAEGVEGAPPPSPPHSPTPESSTTLIQREAVEDFKKSDEFKDLLATAEVKGLVEGFYACRGWINFHSPQLNLSRYTFSTILRRFRYPLHGYLEETEVKGFVEGFYAAIERRRFEEDAQRAAGHDVLDPEDLSSPVPRY